MGDLGSDLYLGQSIDFIIFLFSQGSIMFQYHGVPPEVWSWSSHVTYVC